MKVADMHCDTIMQIWYSRLRGNPVSLRDSGQTRRVSSENGKEPDLMVDLEKMKKGEYLLQNFAVYTDLHLPWNFSGKEADFHVLFQESDYGQQYMDPWYAATEMIGVFHEEIGKNGDLIGEARNYSDIVKNQNKGKMSGILTIEEGGILKGDISRISALYDEGVRMMTLTWNYENELGFPNRPADGFREDFRKFYRFVPEKGNGLKRTGFEALEEMERLGILADVSHLSDEGFYNVAQTVKGPFAASHSNARSVAGCSRNLTDDMIRVIAEHGGIIGLNFCPSFVMEASSEELCRTSCEGLARHARHIMNVGGREVLGLGTDFDGIGHENLEIPDASGMQKLCEYLETHGFTQEEIERIFYKNVLSLYKEVLR